MMRYSYSLELRKQKLLVSRLKLDMDTHPEKKEEIEQKIQRLEERMMKTQKMIDDGLDEGPRTI